MRSESRTTDALPFSALRFVRYELRLRRLAYPWEPEREAIRRATNKLREVRGLPVKDIPWQWEPEHVRAFVQQTAVCG